MPAAAAFDPALQRGESLEAHENGEFVSCLAQQRDDLIGEKSAVGPDFQMAPRAQCSPERADTPLHERRCPIGFIDIAGAMQQIEDLAGLGYGAIKRIVAALPFLARIEADRRPVGKTGCREAEPSKSSVTRRRLLMVSGNIGQ